MYHSFHHHFNLHNVTLHPGEYKVSNEDIIISTVLGSCISVALFDQVNKQGGMNHFMLPQMAPGRMDETLLIKDENRYGVYAMEILINSLMKMGARKSSLIAKVFGGGEMFDMSTRFSNIGKQNADFAFLFLKNESIPIIASDFGGKQGRKILFFPKNGKILLKKLDSSRKIKNITEHEKEYKDSLLPEDNKGKIILFE